MMKVKSMFLCIGLTWFVAAASADEQAAGARALYYRADDGTSVGTSAPPSDRIADASKPPRNGSPERGGTRPVKPGGKERKEKQADGDVDPGTATATTATGVKYYMELLGAQGQLLRVNSNRVFHSGERFRFMLESNVDGRLTLVQSQNGGAFQRLFPDARVHGGSDRIQSRVTTALPSETGWFRFDDQPGDIRLMVMVVPDAPAAGSGTPGPARPGVATGPMVASRDPAAEAAAIAAVQRRGSRALVVEEDTSAVEAATYAVAIPQRHDDPGELAIEIRLRHER